MTTKGCVVVEGVHLFAVALTVVAFVSKKLAVKSDKKRPCASRCSSRTSLFGALPDGWRWTKLTNCDNVRPFRTADVARCVEEVCFHVGHPRIGISYKK